MTLTTGAVSDTLDLSRLPAPKVIEQISFETIRDDMIADLQARLPSFDTILESDPVIKLIEVAAFREMLLRQQFNDRARSVMTAYATGSDLDHLAALVGVQRLTIALADPVNGTPAIMEADEDLRQRIVLAPESFSVAGPELAYVYHARSAHPDVLDASATSPNPGEVYVTVLSRQGDGTATHDIIDAVADVVNSRPVRPLTDQVFVQSVEVVPFQISAALYTFEGPDSNLIIQAAKDKLNAYLAANRLIGRDITFSALNAALHVDGVQRVDFTTPTATIPIGDTQVGNCTAINVTFAGYAN
jgi:phage-related baseplate assembly protein